MRTIKYRGKTKNGEWLYGDLLQVANEVFIAPSDGDWFDFIPWSRNNVFHLPAAKYAVIPETVGQFTGLYDKDGREIYEGDIIVSQDYSHARHYVRYIDDETMFVAMIIGSSLMEYCAIRQSWIDKYDKKIIGNIYDNPELLNK